MKKELNIGLQSLKGIAAISVFLYHALMQYPSELISGLYHSGARLFFDGESAVLIFMALSGFFYYKDKDFTLNDLWEGILKKIFRICAIYYCYGFGIYSFELVFFHKCF